MGLINDLCAGRHGAAVTNSDWDGRADVAAGSGAGRPAKV